MASYKTSEEYLYFQKHAKWNDPVDVQYVEESFKKDPNFKPFYMCGFDGKPNGFIDNPNTMNFKAREALGLPPLCPGFSTERDQNFPSFEIGLFYKK